LASIEARSANVVTPLMPYVALIVVFVQRYDKMRASERLSP
jgi:p-aminobenzoyl-glutamate transporter AbgT